MSDTEDNRKNIPFWLKIFLRIPRLGLEGFSDRFQGYFWCLGIPLFLFSVFFVNMLLLGFVVLPWNIITTVIADSTIVVLLLRILLERTLTSQEILVNEQRFRWDIEKSFEGYLAMLKDQKSRKDSELQQD